MFPSVITGYSLHNVYLYSNNMILVHTPCHPSFTIHSSYSAIYATRSASICFKTTLVSSYSTFDLPTLRSSFLKMIIQLTVMISPALNDNADLSCIFIKSLIALAWQPPTASKRKRNNKILQRIRNKLC